MPRARTHTHTPTHTHTHTHTRTHTHTLCPHRVSRTVRPSCSQTASRRLPSLSCASNHQPPGYKIEFSDDETKPRVQLKYPQGMTGPQPQGFAAMNMQAAQQAQAQHHRRPRRAQAPMAGMGGMGGAPSAATRWLPTPAAWRVSPLLQRRHRRRRHRLSSTRPSTM